MAEKEEYIYTFHFVDGKTYEHRRNEDDLTETIMTKGMIEIDNLIINMRNVVKVKREKQSDLDEMLRKNLEGFTGKNYYSG